METIKNKFIRFETKLQGLIEGTTASLFPRIDKINDLAMRLRLAMQDQCRMLDNGEIAAPNIYQIFASPQYADELNRDQVNLQKLQTELETAAKVAGFVFLQPPVIQIIEEPMIPYQQVSVSAYFEDRNLPATAHLDIGTPQAEAIIPNNAFLIVNGVKLYPLEKAVINIGRHPDNQIVINDARVSRQHAQLRAINGRYILFDLSSNAGTYVNNQLVHQAILSPGDVISLAGIPLVYGQDSMETSSTRRLDISAHD